MSNSFVQAARAYDAARRAVVLQLAELTRLEQSDGASSGDRLADHRRLLAIRHEHLIQATDDFLAHISAAKVDLASAHLDGGRIPHRVLRAKLAAFLADPPPLEDEPYSPLCGRGPLPAGALPSPGAWVCIRYNTNFFLGLFVDFDLRERCKVLDPAPARGAPSAVCVPIADLIVVPTSLPRTVGTELDFARTPKYRGRGYSLAFDGENARTEVLEHFIVQVPPAFDDGRAQDDPQREENLSVSS
jgi:hypothetical protein